MRHFLVPVLIVGLAACGGGGSTAPTQPSPAPAPTPTPVPTPTPNPYAAACGVPLPSFDDSYGFGVKVQLEKVNKKILNANPLVKNGIYCAAAGMPNRSICNTRPENAPQRASCDHYLSGISDTGQPGPNWFEDVDNDGHLVPCGDSGTHCKLKPENQYLLDVFAPGTYVACGGKGSPETCGGCVLSEDSWGVIHKNPSGLCAPG